MGHLYLSTQTGGPKITEILSQVLRLKVLNQGVGRTVPPKASKEGSFLTYSNFSQPHMSPGFWPHHLHLCGHSLDYPCSSAHFL